MYGAWIEAAFRTARTVRRDEVIVGGGVNQLLSLIGLLTLVCGSIYGCAFLAAHYVAPVVLAPLLAPLLPPGNFPRDDLGLIKANNAYIPSQAESDALFAKFDEARRLNDLEPRNNAIAVTFTPIPWAFGIASSAETEDKARSLALERCEQAVKLKGLRFPCEVYSVNGRPDPKIAIFF